MSAISAPVLICRAAHHACSAVVNELLNNGAAQHTLAFSCKVPIHNVEQLVRFRYSAEILCKVDVLCAVSGGNLVNRPSERKRIDAPRHGAGAEEDRFCARR